MRLNEPPPDLEADCIRLLRTSAGAHMVVATVPATSDASMCVLTSSWKLVFLSSRPLAAVYLRSHITRQLFFFFLFFFGSQAVGPSHQKNRKETSKTHGAIWPTFINTLLMTVAPSPLPKVTHPSSRTILTSPRRASG